MKILISGGHMAPALAVIAALPRETEIVYVGRMHVFEGDKAISLEYQTITSLGIRFIQLSTGRMQRHISTYTLSSLLKIPHGLYQAYNILITEKPDVVVGFGGYLSIPIGLVAKILRIPLVIHEQTLDAGLANKLLGKMATAVCISWESSRKFFPKDKVVLTGNPLVKEESKVPSVYLPKSQEKLPHILIAGGSAGSHAINKLVEEVLGNLLEKYCLIHQTGDAKEFGDYDRLARKKETLSKSLQQRYSLHKFIEPHIIPSLFKNADLVISRSGINTVTLLLTLTKPSLLIPLPHGQNNEQRKNAYMLEEIGLGMVYEQKHATPTGLLERVTAMMNTLSSYKMKRIIPYPQDADKKIVKVIELCYRKEFKKEKLVISSID